MKPRAGRPKANADTLSALLGTTRTKAQSQSSRWQAIATLPQPAERKAGELLGRMEMNKGSLGRFKKTGPNTLSGPARLDDLGVSKA